ncbi:MAG: hypothetical protein GF368_01015 [Candidatus Aenigmarchaeota archaeon]|nr:hypothetical protein [Candidatus Aenigmarchaeota archaeon]
MKYILLLLIIFVVLLVGFTENSVEPVKIPNINDNPEAFYCDADVDCVMQSISCNNCDCPIAINKNFVQPLNCEYKSEQPYCDLYCYPSVPKCINNSCTAIRKDS